MENIFLRLFGPPLVFLNGTNVRLKRRKSLALLSYLAVNGKTYGRDHLATLFWSDYPGPRALSNLRTALSDINRLAPIIVGDRDTVTLGAETVVDTDVTQLESTVRKIQSEEQVSDNELRKAAELHEQQFFGGFGVDASPEFDDWLSYMVDSTGQNYACILDALKERELAAGRVDKAIEQCHKRIQIDIFDEDVHRELMTLYARVGKKEAAIAHYLKLKEMLARELQSEPDERTTQLYNGFANDAQGKSRKIVPKDFIEPETISLHDGRKRRKRIVLIAALSVVVLASMAITATSINARNHKIPALAVMPLSARPADSHTKLIADALTDGIITETARTTGLAVRSYLSVKKYQESEIPLKAVSQELGVDYLVEGSVNSSDEETVVTIRLIRCDKDRTIWSEELIFDHFDLLSESMGISQAVSVELVKDLPAGSQELLKKESSM